MFFRKKYKRAIEVMRLRNKEYLGKMNADNPKWDKENGAFYGGETPAENKAGSGIPVIDAGGDISKCRSDESEETSEGKRKKEKRASRKKKNEDYKNVMEKNDLSAIILSAFIVFGPILLILILILFFVAWLVLH